MMNPVIQFEIGDFKNFVYLILDHETKKAAIVDPQSDLTLPLQHLNKSNYKLESILLTHSHHDHIAGVGPLLNGNSELNLYVGQEDLHRLSKGAEKAKHLKILKDGQVIRVGNLEIEALHTPGHSAGEFCYFIKNAPTPILFTGDTIFIRDCGRTDFPDSSNTQMFQSIQRIKKLPPETILYVGHHYKDECVTTLADELKHSPPFQAKSVEELAALP